MVRLFVLSLIFGVAVSLIWWPGAYSEAAIFELIAKERMWQVEHLGLDLVMLMDGWMRGFEAWVGVNPIPYGEGTSIEATVGMAEEEMRGAVWRTSQTPYFKALFALIVLVVGRLCTVVVLAVILMPLLLACVVDGLTEREVREAAFKMPESFHFRVAGAFLGFAVEAVVMVAMCPVWVSPYWILVGFLMVGVGIYALTVNWYKG